MLCLSASESIIWSSSQPSVNSSKNEINYLAHHVSKEGVWPSNDNLKAVDEFAPSQSYTEIGAFLGFGGTLLLVY